jgi:hypothetical protein
MVYNQMPMLALIAILMALTIAAVETDPYDPNYVTEGDMNISNNQVCCRRPSPRLKPPAKH